MRALELLLQPINQCKYTGLEKELTTKFPALTTLEDNFGNVRIQHTLDGDIVAAIALELDGGIYEVSGIYVKEDHRRQGIGRQLFGAANLIFKNKVRHSDNLTSDGERFVRGGGE